MKKHFLLRLVLLGALCPLIACNPTKYLSKGQRLYNGGKVEVISEELSKKEKADLKTNLKLLNRQQVNKNASLMAYYRSLDLKAGAGFKYWWFNLQKEEPEFFDTLTIHSIAKSMENYLKRSGYFQAKVDFTYDVSQYYGTVTYYAHPNKSYKLNDISYEVLEPRLANFLAPYWQSSLLQPGEVVSDNLYQQEKLRVVNILKNNGFYYFDPGMISPLIADSVGSKVNVSLLINESKDPTVLTRFKLGRINIHSDFNPDYNRIYNLDTMINGYRFLQINKELKVKPHTLMQYMYIKPGDFYAKDNFDRTFSQLNRLGLYRYVNIRESRDEKEPDKLNVDIFLPPAKTLSYNTSLDFNRTNLRTGLDKFQSLAFQTGNSLSKRNLFNGGELLQMNLDYAVERSFRKGPNTVSRNEVRFRNQLSFPRFLDYLGIVNAVSRIKDKDGTLIDSKFIDALHDRVTTNVNLDFEFVDFYTWYRFFNINASYGFLINQDAEHKYVWNNFGFSYFIPKSFSNYDEILKQNLFLTNTFKSNRLFTGFLLKDFTFDYNKATDALGNTYGANITAELSGFEVNALNKLFDPSREWKLFNKIEFNKFWKISVSGYRVDRIGNNLFGAAKLTLGAAHAFGSTIEVPYIKQFEIGGPFSIRGWSIRKLGPGGFKDSTQLIHFPDGPYYETGDIKLELISEIRFPIYYIFKGAVFLDAGNVWSWKQNETRPGAHISKNFLNDIAIGSGFGLRLDLSLFVIRLDLGTQLKNPYPVNGHKFFPNRTLGEVWDNIVWNIAVNYPF